MVPTFVVGQDPVEVTAPQGIIGESALFFYPLAVGLLEHLDPPEQVRELELGGQVGLGRRQRRSPLPDHVAVDPVGLGRLQQLVPAQLRPTGDVALRTWCLGREQLEDSPVFAPFSALARETSGPGQD